MPAKVRGFTLLELMIVIVIIATLATFAVLAVGDGGRAKKLTDAAYRLRLVAELGAQEAVLRGRPVAVSVHDNAYEFETYIDGQWKTYPDGRSNYYYQFSDDIELQRIDADYIDAEPSPVMIFLPDGENLLEPLALTDLATRRSIQLLPIDGVYDTVEIE